MKITNIILFSVLLSLTSAQASGGRKPAAKTPESIRIAFTANRQGEIEPCGCQTGQIGGLNRMASFLDVQRHEGLDLFVDSGDAFFAANPMGQFRREEAILNSELIARAYEKMGLDVLSLGERDFAAGIDHLRKLERLSQARFVTTNLRDKKGKLLFEEFVFIERGNKKIAVFSLASPQHFSTVAGVNVGDPVKKAKSLIPKLREKGADVVLLLSHLGLEADRKIAALDIDIIVGAHSLDVLDPPTRVNSTVIVQPAFQGQQLGILNYSLVDRKKTFQVLQELGTEFESRHPVKAMMEKHKSKVRALAFSKKRPKTSQPVLEEEQKPYVAHAFHCRTCHQPQYDFWASTKHSSAYLVLYAKNRHFDPECIACHSLGFQEPGGFRRIAYPIVTKGKGLDKKKGPFVEQLMKTVFKVDPGNGPLDSRTEPKRYKKLHKAYTDAIHLFEKNDKIEKLYIGVQCEHCHGNRHGHPSASVPTQKKVKKENCLQCHTPPNDTSFDFKKSLPKIACPLRKSS